MSALLHVLAESAQIDVDTIPTWDGDKSVPDPNLQENVHMETSEEATGKIPTAAEPSTGRMLCQPEVKYESIPYILFTYIIHCYISVNVCM